MGVILCLLQGFLVACEVRHFCSEVLQGRVRSIEALYSPPEGVVVCTPPWLGLMGMLQQPGSLLGKSFVASCMGQAVLKLSTGPRRPGDVALLKPGVDLASFATSCRSVSNSQHCQT